MHKYCRIIGFILSGCFVLSACSTTPSNTSSVNSSGNASNISENASNVSVSSDIVSDSAALQSGGTTSRNNSTTSKSNGSAPQGGTTSQGSGSVISSQKLPDLKVNVMSNPYKKKTYNWSFDGTGSTIDYLDSLDQLDSSASIRLASDAEIKNNIGISTWVQATGTNGYVQYKVADLAGLMMEWYSKSAMSNITVKVSSDGKSFTDLIAKAISSANCSGGYKKYTLALNELPDSGMKYVRIPVSESTYLGRVILDDYEEVSNKAPYDVTFEYTDNIKVKNGVYEVSNERTAQLILYRNDVRGARFVLRYKGSAPRLKLEASDEGNKYTEVKWFMSKQTTENGYTYCTVSADGMLPQGTTLVRLSLQRGKSDSLALTEIRLSAPELYHLINGTNPMYRYSDSITVRGREDMLGASVNGVGEGYIMYNVNDIKEFHMNLWYEKPGEITVYGSSDTKSWKAISCTKVDEHTKDGKTYYRLHNSGTISANTNYLKIVMKCAKNGYVTSVSSIHIEGDHNLVKEIQRICKQQGVTFQDVFSVTHANARYSLRNDVDCINEGVEAVAEMGGKMINLWFNMQTYKTDFSFNTDWFANDSKGTLKGLAQTSYFKKAFSNPNIERYTLFVHSLNWYPMNLPLDATDADRELYLSLEYDDVYALADYLMKEYNGTGKTFIFQTWESDAWITNNGVASENGLRNYRDYINNRQKAVSDARKKNPKSDVKLYNCMEISWVETAASRSLLETVIPQTNCDLYAYSCWETCIVGGRGNYAEALEKFASKVHASELLGKRNYYIGEYGIPETEYGSEMFFTYNVNNCKAILNAGYRYANYWQLFCNESYNSNAQKENKDMRGFWLIRADGTKTGLYNLFKMLLHH